MRARGPGSYRNQSYGVLLPAASAKAVEHARHPMSQARIRKELNAFQVPIFRRKDTGERNVAPSPVYRRRNAHFEMHWPNLERNILPLKFDSSDVVL